jgi:S-adenosyl methyltransferase/Protein kinase domain
VEALTEADPREVGEYQLLGRLGSGGMGRVFLAVSPSGRMVAVKVIRPELAEDPKFIRRFRDEVDAARRVSGFYTAPVVAAGPDEELPWLATAFVPGPSLDEVTTMHGPLPVPALWRLAAGLAEALRAIHSAGLVHRDLKPANVMLAPDGPRVIDFGIARTVAGTRLTTTGAVVGTPSFMSPEQVEGQPAGPASDMFSFGSVLAFAASGIPPFSTGPGGSRTSAMYRIVHGEPDLAGVAEGIRELITACLAKDPARRPAPGQVDTYHANAVGQPGPRATTFWPSGVARVIAAQQAALGEQLQAPQPAIRFPARTPAHGDRPVATLPSGPEPAAPGPAAAPAAGSGSVGDGSVSDFDPTRPNAARVYDYFLGGKDNFAADRELADRLTALVPSTPVTLRENKEFLGLAVAWVAGQGIRQFIDLGAGMPTSPATHETAQAAATGARVVYLDNDPVVLAHLNALAAKGNPGVTVVNGDVREPDAILPAVAQGVDLSEPACVILGSLLHFFPAETARDLVARYTKPLAPGSLAVLSMGIASGEAAAKFFRLYSEGPTRLYQHTPEDFASFFGPLELLPPGIGDARTWRPGGQAVVPALPTREGWMIVGVARVG